MKIRQLQIERFGAWQDVAIALAPRGLTVLYGPNETGKTTLVRFIRSLLYGFQPQDELGGGARPRTAGCAGELVISDGDQDWILRRASASGGQAELRRRATPTADSAPTLARLLGGISRDVYERVFAVGLRELQELATLHGNEVADFLYQVSLGDDGELVLAACQRSQAARRAVLGDDRIPGQLQRCQQTLREIDEQLEACRSAESRHAELLQEHAQLVERIAEQEWRQRGLRDQLRGHLFLERVWGPWRRQQKLQQERDSLPVVANFPPDGVQRLTEIDAALADLRRQYERCRDTCRRLAAELRRSGTDRNWRRRLPDIRALVHSYDALHASHAQLPALKARADAARRQLDERLRLLGPGWSEARLEKIDANPAAVVRLVRLADRYRAAARNRTRVIRAYRRAARSWQQRQSQHAAILRPYAGAGVREAREHLQQELAELHELQQAQTRHAAALRRLDELRADSAALTQRRELPAHFYPALAALALAGVALAIAGLWRFLAGGGIHAGLVGAIFTLLGVCCGGLTWTIRQRLEPDDDDRARWQQRLAAAQSEVQELERELLQLARPAFEGADDELDGELRIAGRDGVGDASDAAEIYERLAILTDRLTELGAAEQTESALSDRRQRLSAARQRIRLLQRSVSQTRRDWCTALKEAGLDESLRVDAALDQWQAVHDARRQQLALHTAQAEAQHVEHAHRDLLARVAALAREMSCDESGAEPATLLAHWRNALETAAANDARRTALLREFRAARAERRALRRQLRQLRMQHRQLLASADAADRDEFLQRAAAWQRRQELQALIDEAANQLAQAAAGEPQLAVVEEDLLRYDGTDNRTAIDTIETELDDLQSDIQSDRQRLGRVEQELESLEADRRPVELRFARAQADDELHRAVARLAAIELAARALDALRSQLETERQPATLLAAARYLQQLTAGKYRRVWAPLGERTLIVDDDRQQSFRVDHLSSGTREQLFLAIRLALIDEFLRQGVELPIVLDDLFVNFDQQRTEAAVQTVIDYAADGRQLLLLTCHQHLVRLFESAGATTVRLPDQNGVLDRRRVG